MNRPTVPGRSALLCQFLICRGHLLGIMVTVSLQKIFKVQLTAVACCIESIVGSYVGLSWDVEYAGVSSDFVGPGTGTILSFLRG